MKFSGNWVRCLTISERLQDLSVRVRSTAHLTEEWIDECKGVDEQGIYYMKNIWGSMKLQKAATLATVMSARIKEE